MEFVNLHVHSTIGSWDSPSKIDKLVKFAAKNLGQTALAITEHGSMSSCIKFHLECKKHNIKSIQGCLLENQEIFTPDGIKLIKDISAGDKVYTHTGKTKQVIGVMEREHDGYIYTIELANSKSRSMKITGEHPVLISDNKGNKNWVKVEDIQTKRINKGAGITNYQSYICCPKIYGDLKEIKTKSFLPKFLSIKNGVITKNKKNSKYDTLKKEWRNFSEYILLDKKFCYFWGLFVSEGSITIHQKDKTRLTGQCCLTFNTKEKNLVNFCVAFLKDRFNINATILDKPNKESVDVQWCNLPFAYIFKKLTNCPAINKKIHEIAFRMPLYLQEFLLEGILDGDCKHLTDKNLSKQQTLKTCSQNFAWGFRQLLINFDTFSRVTEGTDGKNNEYKYYAVAYNKYSKYKRSFSDKNYVYYPIKYITKEKIKTKVYNFHVDKDNSYLSDFALHNCELYICPPGQSSLDKSAQNRRLNHLVVLAKNEKGFKNLLKLTSLANDSDRFYHRPRIDEELLFQYSEGLIVLNGHYDTSIFDCLFYNIDGVAKSSSLEEAKGYLYPDYKEKFLEVANRYKGIFGDDFYIECQLFDPNDIVQQLSGHVLFSLAQEFGFKSVGTGDVHYISPQDCDAHATFVAIKQQKKIKDLPNIGYFKSGKYCLVSNEEAKKYYPKELIEATHEIVGKIEDYAITRPQSIPKVQIDGISAINEVKRICEEELIKRGLDNKEYRDRLNYELEITELGELEHYFLIVRDYIKWAENNNIYVGRARGSVSGSLISMLLGITKPDPIKNGLSFERFYSPDRAESKILPDIDSDFQATRRDEVVEYIKGKYGADKVCGVVTFNVLQAKSAIKDVLRIWDVCDFKTQNEIADLFDAKDKISDQLAEFKAETGHESAIMFTLITNPDLLKDYCYLDKEELKGDYARFFDLAIQLEGSIKSVSRHASAYIISDRPIDEVAPLTKDSKTSNLLCALDMYSFESAGLVKFDILGIRALDGLAEVNRLIKEIDINDLQ